MRTACVDCGHALVQPFTDWALRGGRCDACYAEHRAGLVLDDQPPTIAEGTSVVHQPGSFRPQKSPN
jgi:hypothetical protein